MNPTDNVAIFLRTHLEVGHRARETMSYVSAHLNSGVDFCRKCCNLSA